MKMHVFFSYVFVFGLAMLWTNTQAQDDVWGACLDQSKVGMAKEKNALMDDNVRAENYTAAVEPIEWLLKECPKLNLNLYVQAIKTYEALEDAEKDEAKKKEYQDRVLELYDLRLEYGFGDEDEVLKRKGHRMYPYLIRRADRHTDIYKLYERLVHLRGNDSYRSHLTYLMDMAGRIHKKDVIDADSILRVYDAVSAVINYNIENDTKKKAKWEKTKNGVDQLLTKYVEMSCDRVKDIFGPKIEADPTNVDVAKKALAFLLSGSCVKDENYQPFFMKVGQLVYDDSKDFGLGKAMMNLHLGNKDYDKALEVAGQIVENAEEAEDKADIQMKMASILASKNKKSEARKAALAAAEAYDQLEDEEAKKAGKSKVYTLIGDLYMGSSECTANKDVVRMRAVYMAAYDMYARAGNGAKMAQAKAQFPSAADIHTLNLSPGETLEVGCWIGGTTTLRKR
jgi:hypothetical protein